MNLLGPMLVLTFCLSQALRDVYSAFVGGANVAHGWRERSPDGAGARLARTTCRGG